MSCCTSCPPKPFFEEWCTHMLVLCIGLLIILFPHMVMSFFEAVILHPSIARVLFVMLLAAFAMIVVIYVVLIFLLWENGKTDFLKELILFLLKPALIITFLVILFADFPDGMAWYNAIETFLGLWIVKKYVGAYM